MTSESNELSDKITLQNLYYKMFNEYVHIDGRYVIAKQLSKMDNMNKIYFDMTKIFILFRETYNKLCNDNCMDIDNLQNQNIYSSVHIYLIFLAQYADIDNNLTK